MHLYCPLLLCVVCTERVQDLAVVMICRCRTASVKSQPWSPLMRSKNKPGVHKIASVSRSDFAADVDTTVGGRREERGKEDGAEKWKGREGRGEEMNQDPTFQMRTVIKLIAWQSQSRITMLHWQTCSIISRVPAVSSCTEQSCLLERDAFFFKLCSLAQHCLWGSTTVMNTEKGRTDSTRPPQKTASSQLFKTFFLKGASLIHFSALGQIIISMCTIVLLCLDDKTNYCYKSK